MGFVSDESEQRLEERWSGKRVNTSSVHMVGKSSADTREKSRANSAERHAALPVMDLITIKECKKFCVIILFFFLMDF